MKRAIAALVLAGLALGGTLVQAQEHDGHQSKTLKLIMQDLGKAMSELNDAIFKDDWEAIALAGQKIADHPHVMPEELKAISGALGKDMQHFKHRDHAVHEAALGLAKAAKGKNMKELLAKHQTIMSGCVACHDQFRTKVQKALGTAKP